MKGPVTERLAGVLTHCISLTHLNLRNDIGDTGAGAGRLATVMAY